MHLPRRISAPPLPVYALVFVVLAVSLSACSSKKLMSIYDPAYIEQLEAEVESGDLILPPGLSLSASDEFSVPEKIDAQVKEYENIFSIFSGNRDFSFRSDGQGRYWLTTRARPERVWLGLKEFFRIEGLEIDYENFAVGEMRTRWAENLARNRFPDAIFHHADRYLIQVLPSSRAGWVDIHLRHQGVTRDLRPAVEIPADSKSEGESRDRGDRRHSRRHGKSGKQDEVLDSYLRIRQTNWQPSPSEPYLVLEMLTRVAVFLGSPQDEAQKLRRSHVTGILGRIYLERSEFGDIGLVVGDNLPRTYFYLERVLTALPQFSRVDNKGKPERLSFLVRDYQELDPSLPDELSLYFIRKGEYVKLLLFDRQDNIINPIQAEGVYRALASALRPKYVQVDLDDIELLDTKSLSPAP